MDVWTIGTTDSNSKPTPFGNVLALIALGSAVVAWSLHGHACTGDGCVLCLAAMCAYALLFTSLGVAIARPIVRILFGLQVLRLSILPSFESRLLAASASDPRLGSHTPVTMGVELLI